MGVTRLEVGMSPTDARPYSPIPSLQQSVAKGKRDAGRKSRADDMPFPPKLAVHDPVVSIAQSIPGIQCAFTGEQGGVFVVDDRAVSLFARLSCFIGSIGVTFLLTHRFMGQTVQVKPPQSFVRADCRVARLQV